jgi:hypothetical protein
VDANELISSVELTIGLDAYRHYPESRRQIPEIVVTSVAIAALTQFLKGFVDFEKLGNKSRDILENTLRRWRGKETLESEGKVDQLEKALTHALRMVPGSLPENEYREAIARLEEALKEFGLPTETAKERAEKIASLMSEFAANQTKR